MADLREDLIKSIIEEKRFEEIELNRLSADPNMNYREKLEKINEVLKKIVLANMKTTLIDFYYGQPQQPQQPQKQGIHNGQTHGE